MKYVNVYDDFDVVIVGGGISGTMAAISAARNGAKVLIIDQNGYLGGTLTANGVGPMMTFFAGEKQVIKGLGQEMVDNLQKQNYSPGHILDTTNYISYVTPFDAEGLKIVLDQMVTAAGVSVLFHSYLVETIVESEKVQQITIVNKDGRSLVKAPIFIDATGDGDLAVAAGAEYTIGREGDHASQPLTMNMKVYDVDSDKIIQAVLKEPESFERINRNIDNLSAVDYFSFIGFEKQFNLAKKRNEIHIPREDILFFQTNNPGEYIMNTTRVINKSGVNAKEISEAEVIGRQQCAELYKFLVNYIPGFEHAKVSFTGPSIGVRSSRQIIGDYTLIAEDILNNKKFNSVIAHNGYPIDIHNPDGEGTQTVKLASNVSTDTTYYEIPLEIMYPKHFSNLLVTGRCVSTSFEAQAAIRTTPTMTALGQACGLVAALAKDMDDVRDINVRQLQDKLVEQGAYLEL